MSDDGKVVLGEDDLVSNADKPTAPAGDAEMFIGSTLPKLMEAGESKLEMDFEDEVEVIRRFHEAQVARSESTWHHFLLYRNGVRTVRVRIANFSDPIEKRSAFARAMMLGPASGADEYLWIAEVWMRVMEREELEAKGLLFEDVLKNKDALDEAMDREGERKEAIIAIGLNKDYWRLQMMPFENREGLVVWDDKRTHVIDSVSVTSTQAMGYESWVGDLVQGLLATATKANTDHLEALTYVLSRTGFEIKTYE